MCLSIFPAFLNFWSMRRRTLWRRIHKTFKGRRALAVPLRLPIPIRSENGSKAVSKLVIHGIKFIASEWNCCHVTKEYTVRVDTRSMRGCWTTGCLAGWMYFNPHILAPFYRSKPVHHVYHTRVSCSIARPAAINLLLERRTHSNISGAGLWFDGLTTLVHSYISTPFRLQFVLLTGVSSLSLGLVSQADASTGVHDGRLLDDETIPLQTSNVAARVGQGNFVGLVGIQPNFALSALEDGGGEALLELKIDCN